MTFAVFLSLVCFCLAWKCLSVFKRCSDELVCVNFVISGPLHS